MMPQPVVGSVRVADVGVQIMAIAGGASVRHGITAVQIGFRRAVGLMSVVTLPQRQDAIGVGRTVRGHGGRGDSGHASSFPA